MESSSSDTAGADDFGRSRTASCYAVIEIRKAEDRQGSDNRHPLPARRGSAEGIRNAENQEDRSHRDQRAAVVDGGQSIRAHRAGSVLRRQAGPDAYCLQHRVIAHRHEITTHGATVQNGVRKREEHQSGGQGMSIIDVSRGIDILWERSQENQREAGRFEFAP
ncbi:MAG: hypothetical protein R3A46_20960 [Thermomicrobiales bacterium]